jgi:hypothetical protein
MANRATLLHPADFAITRCYNFWSVKFGAENTDYSLFSLDSMLTYLETPTAYIENPVEDEAIEVSSGDGGVRFVLRSDAKRRLEVLQSLAEMLPAQRMANEANSAPSKLWCRVTSILMSHFDYIASQDVIRESCSLVTTCWNTLAAAAGKTSPALLEAVSFIFRKMESSCKISVPRAFPFILNTLLTVISSAPKHTASASSHLQVQFVGDYIIKEMCGISSLIWRDIQPWNPADLEDMRHVITCCSRGGDIVLALSAFAPIQWNSYLTSAHQLWSSPRDVPGNIISVVCYASQLSHWDSSSRGDISPTLGKFIQFFSAPASSIVMHALRAAEAVFTAINQAVLAPNMPSISEKLAKIATVKAGDASRNPDWLLLADMSSELCGQLLLLCPQADAQSRALLFLGMIARLPYELGINLNQSTASVLEKLIAVKDPRLMRLSKLASK